MAEQTLTKIISMGLGVALLGLAGCSRNSEPAVPQVTVGGVPDSQRSLAPDEVLAARKQAAIQACPASDLEAKAREGGLPALTLDCLGRDSKVNLAGLPTGGPRVVNLWAQWCQPCTDEAPAFGEVSKRARGKVDFLGIDYADPFPGKAIDFAVRHGTLYPQLVDPDKDSRAPLRVSVVPQTFFVDASGLVVHRELKPYTDATQLREAVKQHLGVQL